MTDEQQAREKRKQETLRYLPLEQATSYPQSDCEILSNRWWAHTPGKGLMFHSRNRYMMAPQCNSNRAVTDMIVGKMYPDA